MRVAKGDLAPDLPPEKLKHVRGWRRTLTEDDLHAALEVLQVQPKGADADAWRAYYERAVSALRLPGHEAGVDVDLAEAQIRAEFEGAARFAAVWRAVKASIDALGEPWGRVSGEPVTWADLGLASSLDDGETFQLPHAGQLYHWGWSAATFANGWASFVAGALCLRVVAPELGFVGGVNWDEVAPHFDRGFVSGNPLAGPDEFDAGDIHEAVSAIERALEVKGLYRGPCQICGFERWPVPWRERAQVGGRPRLSDSLCPACETAKVRRREASHARAKRERRG